MYTACLRGVKVSDRRSVCDLGTFSVTEILMHKLSTPSDKEYGTASQHKQVQTCHEIMSVG